MGNIAEAGFSDVLELDPHHWWTEFKLANR